MLKYVFLLKENKVLVVDAFKSNFPFTAADNFVFEQCGYEEL